MESRQTFSETIHSNYLVLVDFFTAWSWCGPCKMMPPILAEVSSRMGDKVKIMKIDVDRHPMVASVYHVQNIPALLLFKNGEVVWRSAGVINAAQLANVIGEFDGHTPTQTDRNAAGERAIS